jgi:hypothetical protein
LHLRASCLRQKIATISDCLLSLVIAEEVSRQIHTGMLDFVEAIESIDGQKSSEQQYFCRYPETVQ